MYFKNLSISFASSLILENTLFIETHHWKVSVVNGSIWFVLKTPFSKGIKASGILGFKFSYKVFIDFFVQTAFLKLITI